MLIQCGNRGGPWQFSVAVTAPADFAFLKGPSGASFNPDTYRAAAMKGGGDPGRGRRLFADLKGLACIKCHAVGKDGGNVGPELGSIGSKYPRDELIASVLNPSAKISSGFEPEVLALADGRVVTGIVRNETADDHRDPGCRRQARQGRQGRHRRAEAQRRLAHAQWPGAGDLARGLRRPGRVSRDAQERRDQEVGWVKPTDAGLVPTGVNRRNNRCDGATSCGWRF